MRGARVAGLVLAGLALTAAPAQGKTFGSTFPANPNTLFGCEAAIFQGAVVPSNQTSCTYRHVGYIGNFNRTTSIVPGDGRITEVKILTGANPADARVTILNASNKIDRQGNDVPGTFSCCTAQFVGKRQNLRPNKKNTIKTNIPVSVDVSKRRRIKSYDMLAVSFQNPGFLPLFYNGTGGQFLPNSPLAAFWYPLTREGDPRVDAASQDGLDLLVQWEFKRG